MSTETMEQPEQNSFNLNACWPSIAIAGVIFGLIATVLNLAVGYMTINSEPSGSWFSPLTLAGGVVCLLTAFGGILAVWHYAKEVSPILNLGQGALIGFLVGVVIVLTSMILGQIWNLIDPDYTQKTIEAAIANIEAMDMPSDMKEDIIASTAESMNPSIGTQLLWGIPIMGLLNLLSGLIGAAIFRKKEEESF